MLIAFVSRFETSMQASNNGAATQQEPNIKLLDDFKTMFNQLRLDKESELQLNNRIFELGQSNNTLVVEKMAREREIQGLANQVDELKRDLADTRGQLSSKNDELATALAVPKEDPRLRAQIHDLETANNIVTGKFESSNQKQAKLKKELGSFQELVRGKDQKIKDWEQKLNDTQSRIRNLQEEKTKYLATKQQEIERACSEERQRIAKAAEASKATMKMKLESEINHLEQNVKEKDDELALAKEELQKVQDESGIYINTANKLQRELALYKEQVVQQIVHLKRLEEQNPGQEDSDRLANNLQSVRNECTELRNHLESIRSENSQKFEAALRGQQAIEGNLRQIDALENENERLKERNAELQKRVEGLNEAYNEQKALQAGYRGDQLTTSELKDIAFATPQGMLRLSQQTQDHRPSSAHAHSLVSGSILKNHRVLDGHRVDTPEEALRKAAKGIGSHNLTSGSQAGNAAQTSSEKVDNYVETPQVRNQEVLNERSTNFNTPNAGGCSMPHARPLKVAGRKHGRFSQSNGTGAVPHHLNPTDPPAQSFQEAYTGSSRFADATDIQGSSDIKPFATLASSIPTPSPFTDLSSMMDHLESTPDQEQLQEGYTKARGKKGSMAGDNVAGIGVLQTFAQRTMRSLEEHDVELDVVHKSQVRVKPPSAAEEALRRRTVQPFKPALRKPTLTNDTVSSSEPRPVNFTEPSKISTRAGSKVASQIQNGHRGSYNRAVSGGKPQTPKAKNPSAARESTQGSSNGKKDSPNIPPVKRNSLKRSGSSTAQTQAAPKRVRTSRGSSMAGRVEVPDSQGTQTF
jgi:hypothetical protein